MFTGIVQAKARVATIERNPFGVRLTIDRSDWTPADSREPRHGDSICVSGVCLTVTETTGKTLAFDVIAETLEKSSLGELKEGDPVNIEPAVTAQQPMGGHFMQGHVDGVGEVVEVHSGEDEWRTRVKPPAALMDTIIPKGSVGIDGVSLTIASVAEDSFEVALIPTTLDLTTLADRQPGDRVNLEADILAKTIVHWLQRQRGIAPGDSGPTREALRQAGFLD
ncbi:MAG: riboflavin synthase [Phycisphaeraceae bacterium]